MKTIDDLEKGDLLYTVAFHYNDYFKIMIRKVDQIYKARDGKALSIRFEDNSSMSTNFLNTNKPTLEDVHFVDLQDFLEAYKRFMKDAKYVGIRRAQSVRYKIKLFKNLTDTHDIVKQALIEESQIYIRRSLFG